MDSLRDLAGRLDESAAKLRIAAGTMAGIDVAARDFGADAAGRLGELGRVLHGQWLSAVDARIREATRAAELITEVAAASGIAAGRYADADDAARRRQAEEG